MRRVEVKILSVECWMLDWMAEATGKVKKLKAEREIMRFLCFLLKKSMVGSMLMAKSCFDFYKKPLRLQDRL